MPSPARRLLSGRSSGSPATCVSLTLRAASAAPAAALGRSRAARFTAETTAVGFRRAATMSASSRRSSLESFRTSRSRSATNWLGSTAQLLCFRGERAHDANGAAPESNRPSRGLHDRTGFEDQLGHRAHAAPRAGYRSLADQKGGSRARVLAAGGIESVRRERERHSHFGSCVAGARDRQSLGHRLDDLQPVAPRSSRALEVSAPHALAVVPNHDAEILVVALHDDVDVAGSRPVGVTNDVRNRFAHTQANVVDDAAGSRRGRPLFRRPRRAPS